VKTVIVKRADLIDRIAANRATHRSEFEKAFASYRERIVTELEQMLDRAYKGDPVDHYIRLPIPEDHTEEYDQVLEMLGMEQRTEVEIDYQTFRQYVMDEWSWKAGFTATNSTYSG
jgi:hypothetical protein